jgi:hypothetical protein
MPYMAVDDSFYDHPKVIALRDGPCVADAIALWTLAGSWSSKALTEGHVPRARIPLFGLDKRAAAELVRVGLWAEDAAGFVFHGWTERNPTKQAVLTKREKTAARVARFRQKRMGNDASSAACNGVTESVGNAVGTPFVRVPPSPQVPKSPVDSKESTLARARDEGDDDRGARTAAAHAYAKAIESVQGIPGSLNDGAFWEIGRLARGIAERDRRTLQSVLARWAAEWVRIAEVRTPGSFRKWAEAAAAGTPWGGKERREQEVAEERKRAARERELAEEAKAREDERNAVPPPPELAHLVGDPEVRGRGKTAPLGSLLGGPGPAKAPPVDRAARQRELDAQAEALRKGAGK